MMEALADQAAGLRRLVSPCVARTLAVTAGAPSADHSAVAANLAVALTRHVNGVLVDACGGPRGSARMLDAEPARDLLEVARDGRAPSEACVQRGRALRVVRAHQALAAVARLPEDEARRVAGALTALTAAADAIIIDAVPGALAPLAAADLVLLVTGDDAEAITASYRFLKRMAAALGPRHVGVVVNAARSPARAQTIFGNLAATAAKFLSLPLECMGQIPHDERQQRAIALRRPLIELFPASPVATALRGCAEMLLASPAHPGAQAFAGRLLAALRTAA
jgi:flagellar biosynthesis protein FlhG